MAGDDRGTAGAAKVPELAWLRRVVTGLALAMGVGILSLVAILWLRLSQPPLPVLPEGVALPAGARAAAVTFARDWTVVVTEAGEVLVYDRAGQLRQRVAVE
ncbi:DUF6476 family protein [Paracoccus sanguinis]|uniref:DUF6476 family protein n=1 Tax=Paracoccus sanguinis TaxID=1545044 RepID=UPI001452304F|nr:DUF6476 family protein [Paracoccus sanguinis]QJD15931.1 hypothetical protein HGN31_02785 [Paracoccus sanguinis]